jgi:hypothetical protein
MNAMNPVPACLLRSQPPTLKSKLGCDKIYTDNQLLNPLDHTISALLKYK